MMLERAGLECQRLRVCPGDERLHVFGLPAAVEVVSSSDDGDEAADGGPVVDLVSCSDDGEEVADGRPEAPSSSSAGPGRETPGQVQLGASADDAEEVASDDSEAMLQQAMRDIPGRFPGAQTKSCGGYSSRRTANASPTSFGRQIRMSAAAALVRNCMR